MATARLHDDCHGDGAVPAGHLGDQIGELGHGVLLGDGMENTGGGYRHGRTVPHTPRGYPEYVGNRTEWRRGMHP